MVGTALTNAGVTGGEAGVGGTVLLVVVGAAVGTAATAWNAGWSASSCWTFS